MLVNFEDITHDLTAKELDLAVKLIPAFKKLTIENKLTSEQIVKKVNSFYNLDFKFNDVRLRKIINFYRTNAILPVCGSAQGYYCSYDVIELRKVVQSLVQRGTSVLDSAFGMEKIIKQEIEKSKNVEQKQLPL